MIGIADLAAGTLGKVAEKVINLIPDPVEREKQRQAYLLEWAKFNSEASKRQTDINQKEAEHPSKFVSGWRPYIGWTCGVGLSYVFIIHPLLCWVLLLNGITELPPAIDGEPLTALITAMLGMGGIRSLEKVFGVSRDNMTQPDKRRNGKSLNPFGSD